MADSFSSAQSALGEGLVKPSKYRTIPDQKSERMPSGIPYIIGNEFAERLSYYGMRSILVVFMTGYLLNRNGELDVMSQTEAQGWYHEFAGLVYLTPILGGILADAFLGRYLTILLLSIVYCLGHFSLAIDDTRLGLLIGLGLITIGAGGIKSSVSANVGDQFGAGNKHLLPRVYGWFYFSINAGSAIATTLCPILLNDKRFGAHYAFGLPGIFMVIATIIFWMGRKKFVHVQPAGFRAWLRETISREGLGAIGRLLIVYAFVCVFWALFDQSGGEWTLQAKKMDLNVLGVTILPAQAHVADTILILIYIPLFNYFLYPAINRFFPLTPLRKIGIGFFLTAASFVVIWWLQTRIEAGERPTIWWQFLAYVFLTAGEVMVSVTGLEFSYTQAPQKMKSVVMGVWLLTVWAGDQFVATLNFYVIPWLRQFHVNLEGSAYYMFFTILMLVTAVLFIFFARFYHGKMYIQGEQPVTE
jgi:POT family proton-dependent oligopeptide transporter